MKNVLCFIFAICFLVGMHANAGVKEVGNGGGAWVCQTRTKIKWVRLVDLFEAKADLGLTIPDYAGRSVNEIFEMAKARLQATDPRRFDAMKDYFTHVYMKQILLPLELKPIDDAFYHVEPSPESCLRGTLSYEQLANYTNFGTLLVRQDLWELLPVVDQAALLLHEVIYAYLRETAGHTDSVQARKIVGYLMSDLELPELKQKIDPLLNNEN